MAGPHTALEDPFGLTGTVLEGQYRADVVIGEGGFGVVYRGWHLSLDQPVAIKVLKGLDGGDPTINALVLEKFRAEARLLYTLSQSSLHIVRALDFGAATMPTGAWAPFMILEWLEGRSLADDLAERRSRGMRGRSVEETLALLEPVIEGLSVAHQRQVAHRDVKPANIFLLSVPESRGPMVKVLDFGIAKIMKEGEAAGTKGTFASFTWLYASPEQLDPRVGATGLATDVYALGLLFTELVTDRQPVDEQNVIDILKAATNTTRRPTPRTRGANVPDEIEAVCRRALAVNPKDRYPTATELWAAFAAARKGGRNETTMQPVSVMAPSQVAPSQVISSGIPLPHPPQSAIPATTPNPGSIAATNVPVPPTIQVQQPQTSPPRGTYPPGYMPPQHSVVAMMSPPPGTHPPQMSGLGGPIMAPFPPTSPPLGTMPPGQMPRRLPHQQRADSTSPIVVVTIIFFVLAVLFAGTCAIVQGACQAASGS